jgi:putative addiction module antidote
MMKAKIQKIGNSMGVILPKEVLTRMHIGLGDELNVSEAPGELKLRVYDDEVARQVELGLELMREYRNVFKALAQ